MTCKYFDSGWCYAPEDVEHNSKNGGCIEPLSCPYLKKNKTPMTEKEHLECEIKELEFEIEAHNKAIKGLRNIQEIKKQELERQRPITLQRIIGECMINHNSCVQLELGENILDRVEVEWFPLEGCHELKSYDYSAGWNDCIRYLKERVRE